jgi:hypothetical protein
MTMSVAEAYTLRQREFRQLFCSVVIELTREVVDIFTKRVDPTRTDHQDHRPPQLGKSFVRMLPHRVLGILRDQKRAAASRQPDRLRTVRGGR